MVAEIALWAALATAVVGAVWDVRTRRIPNWLVGILAVCAVTTTVASGGLELLGSAAIHAGIALAIGVGLFALKAIGAGDAKFYTAAALAVPLDRAWVMFGWVVLAGFLLMIVLMIYYRGLKIMTDGKKRSWTLPYGVPICCGFIAAFLSDSNSLIF
ncbi:prepilin peptidase [Qipengyuania sp. RANM35]|uniref:A24 family peptidase n=1 Tax=Qipengyuania sp. RANM35 TaxID=3068635 RepID=UPI0034DB32FE